MKNRETATGLFDTAETPSISTAISISLSTRKYVHQTYRAIWRTENRLQHGRHSQHRSAQGSQRRTEALFRNLPTLVPGGRRRGARCLPSELKRPDGILDRLPVLRFRTRRPCRQQGFQPGNSYSKPGNYPSGCSFLACECGDSLALRTETR